jgi:methyl-accepting chemotaxis protein
MMFRKLSVTQKVLAIFTAVALVMMALVLIFFNHAFESTRIRTHSQAEASLKAQLKEQMERRQVLSLSNALALAANGTLIEGIKSGRRAETQASLEAVLNAYNQHTHFNSVRVHIHDATIHSWYRTWKPADYGDDLSSFRQTIHWVRQNQKPLDAVEVGRGGMVYRAIVPVLDNGAYLGSLEIYQDFNEIAGKLQKGGMEFLALSDRKLVKESDLKMSSSKAIGQYLVANTENNPDFIAAVSRIDLKTMTEKPYFIAEGYFFTHEPVIDFEKKKVGIYLMARDLSVVDQALTESRKLLYTGLFVAFLLILFPLALSIIFIRQFVLKPIKFTANHLENIATGEGDLTRRLKIYTEDEIGQLGLAFNGFLDKMEELIKQIMGSAQSVANVTNEIAAASEEMAAGAEEQQSQLSEIAASIEEMSAMIMETSQNAGDTQENAKSADESAQQGNATVLETVDSIQGIVQIVEQAAQQISELEEQSQSIGEVIQVIDDIADQTNLLALNANIEAARAGDAGRGFAVVADEVRKLAERTVKATAEISGKIVKIQGDIRSSVEAMHQITTQSQEGEKRANLSGEALNAISAAIQNVWEAIVQIANATNEQSTGADAISRNLENVSTVSKEVANGAQGLAESAEKLNSAVFSLNELIGRFKISE